MKVKSTLEILKQTAENEMQDINDEIVILNNKIEESAVSWSVEIAIEDYIEKEFEKINPCKKKIDALNKEKKMVYSDINEVYHDLNKCISVEKLLVECKIILDTLEQ